ncbi:S-adenosyl-L-methionine-dependent methyltransferase-like [Moorella glycerini]|uniref:23S rRNA (Guanine(745)-N(1))-methyltransferase n=1 Tax=Neomoorella stamsii TaxID=1266720 RepID=A0A9X7J5R0_9FIRM|nr:MULTISPECIES: class I SAM-dependent methyltransferase [Moorella]PRR77050.1 23S rRNA (guanine(745)-N(1))-methyltransferase [Moorella stamsii]CEP68825.1 S-adenosyl-L-methionine-dependent methyltransferase-like [Moorella glycerini]
MTISKWDSYTEQLVGVTATDGQLLRQLARGLVLDVGCGLGGHLRELDNATRRVGVDPGLPGLKRGSQMLPGVAFVCASGYQLPFSSRTFDTVLCIDVIEHVERPQELLLEIRRVLKPNGVLFLQTPNYPVKKLYDFWHWVRRSRPSLADDTTHISKFNVSKIERLVKAVGLEVSLVKGRNLPFQEIIYYPKGLYTNQTLVHIAQKIIIVANNK